MLQLHQLVQVTYSDTFTDILPVVYTGFNTLSLSRLIFLYVTVTPVSTGDIQ